MYIDGKFSMLNIFSNLDATTAVVSITVLMARSCYKLFKQKRTGKIYS